MEETIKRDIRKNVAVTVNSHKSKASKIQGEMVKKKTEREEFKES